MSSAPTSNAYLNTEESSKSSSAVATSIANRAFIEILYCKSHLNAQYSNLESEQYISSVMDPELMINFCPRDYPGIYAVKNSKFEHFNSRIFIKILKAILVYLLSRVCNVIATASEDVTTAQRCIRWNSVMHWALWCIPHKTWTVRAFLVMLQLLFLDIGMLWTESKLVMEICHNEHHFRQ